MRKLFTSLFMLMAIAVNASANTVKMNLTFITDHTAVYPRQ